MAVTAVFAALLLVVGRIGRVTGGLMAISYLVFIAVQYTVSF